MWALAELRAACEAPTSTAASRGCPWAARNGGKRLQCHDQDDGLASEHNGLDTGSQQLFGAVQLSLLAGPFAQHVERPNRYSAGRRAGEGSAGTPP
jgi:hypothetical protein